MTKKISLVVFTLATLLLVGCQQQVQPPKEVEKNTSTATIKVEPSNETSSTGTLTIQSPTSQTTGTLTIGGTQEAKETSATMEKKAMTDTESTGSAKEGAMIKAEGTQKTGN